MTDAGESSSDLDQLRRILLGAPASEWERRLEGIEVKVAEAEIKLRNDQDELKATVEVGLGQLSKAHDEIEALKASFAEHNKMLRALAESVQRAFAAQLKRMDKELAGVRAELKTVKLAQEILTSGVQTELMATHRAIDSKVSIDNLGDVLFEVAGRVRASARPGPADPIAIPPPPPPENFEAVAAAAEAMMVPSGPAGAAETAAAEDGSEPPQPEAALEPPPPEVRPPAEVLRKINTSDIDSVWVDVDQTGEAAAPRSAPPADS